MEGNLSTGNKNSCGSAFGGLDLQGSFLSNMRGNHECEQPNSMADYAQGERGKIVASDEDELNFNPGEMDCQNKGNKNLLWHRVKWTDPMIRLLIMALSYVGDDVNSEGCHGGGGRRNNYNLQKKGKWKSISKVMAERGFSVSPQQCEDKYNDLNKRYRKLNDILGRGTSCEVVENPAILDMMHHLPEKSKDEVRKILSSKHLFYEEMCSYHNGNRLSLPHDPALQRSLMLALKSKDDHGIDDDDDEEDDEHHDVGTDDHEEYEDLHRRGGCGVRGDSAKRIKKGNGGYEDSSVRNPQPIILDFQSGLQSQNPDSDMQLTAQEGQKAYWAQNQWFKSQSVQLEEQKLQIQVEMLDLEKQRLKWQRYSKKKDRELEMLRIENDRMRIENERMTIKLKQKELAMQCQQ